MSTVAPRLLVLMCTHNGERHLPSQLASLAAQSLQPVAVVMHDWDSRDCTRALLREFAEKQQTSVPVQLVLHDQAPGPAASFLHALQCVLAERDDFDLLLFCDQDDVWASHKLARLAETWCADRDLDLLYSDVSMIDAKGRQTSPTLFKPGGDFGRPMDIGHASTLFLNTVPGMALAVTRRLLSRCAPAWQVGDWTMHDWAVLVMAHLCGARWAFVPESLVAYRQHETNLVGGPGASRVARGWSRSRAHVAAVHRQYAACATLPTMPGVRRPPPDPSRWSIAHAIWRTPSLRWPKALKVALGTAGLWPTAG